MGEELACPSEKHLYFSLMYELLMNLFNLTVPQGKNLVIMQCTLIYVDQIIPWKANRKI